MKNNSFDNDDRLLQPAPVRPAHQLMNHPRKLFVEVTTRCNLGCSMCVKQTPGCEMPEGDMTPFTFSALESAFPHLDAVILNGVGEPLLNPHLEEFIGKAKSMMPKEGWVGFQSNGLLITEERALSLAAAGLDRICLSFDAVAPETFQSLRAGGELRDIERALAALSSAAQRTGRRELRIGIEFVVMRRNLKELPLALRWAASQGVSFALVTHVLPYDEHHAGETAYSSCTTEALELFKACRKKAESLGLDMSRYFEARWKYKRNEDEQTLIALVDAMKAEADEQGLFVDMKKLLLMDVRRIDEVASVFAEARTVAQECGLELQLPEINLREKRHCDFIEEGGAFVSWEGKISPCYFLWHRYRCFAGGWSQEVKPRIFGMLAEQTILDIWNTAEYRSFRAQATRYDYPNCSSCCLAPCDYIQTDNFEQDCHVGDVPCGSCLWCMGTFQCLR